MKRIIHLIILLPSILYLFLATKEFYWDGVIFSLEIERSNGNLNDLFRANHLIYNLAGYFLFDAFDGRVRALFLLQILNGLSIAPANIHFAFTGSYQRVRKC